MLIAQISDFHVVAPNQKAYGRIDSPAMLRHAISVLNALKPQPDLVIGSGDLVETGAPEEYAHLLEILADLKAPFAPVVGNHDHRKNFVEAFGSEMQSESAPFVQSVRDLGNIQVVLLDTVTENSSHASFCEERAAWLDRVLDASPRSVLLVTHHPIFPTGIEWMDPPASDWPDKLYWVLEKHFGKIIAAVSGHIHRAIHTRVAGIALSSCPSTAHQVALDFESPGPTFTQEAPGFQLHRIDGGEVTTYTASLERFLTGFDPRES